MPLNPGTTLGPYEILSPIGAGGMGQVWQATDTQLNPRREKTSVPTVGVSSTLSQIAFVES